MTANKNKPQTACAYIRVSTDKQDELSPDAQKRLLLAYAEANQICILKEYIFVENGISGKKADKRPEFMRMIGLAKSKEHPFDIILVWKFSRFARNQEESIVYKSLLRKNNVEVLSISEPLVDGPFGSLIERIIEWMDEYYSIRLSGEVIRGMTEKAIRGGYQSHPPFGYQMNSAARIPYVVEKEAELVRSIYHKYAYEGKNFLTIARELNALGYKTQRGKAFEQRTIRYILENPFYTGKVRWNRQNRNTHTLKEPSEWIIAAGVHESIIDNELFDLVQGQIRSRTRPYKSRLTSSPNHWLTGAVRCSACGHTLAACRKGNENGTYYFQCSAYNKGACHVSHAVDSVKLENSVIEAFEKVLNTADALYEKKQVTDIDTSGQISNLRQQLKKADEKEHRIQQAYLNGIDTLEEYKRNRKDLQNERDQLLNQLAHIKNASDDQEAQRKTIHNVYDIIKDEHCDKTLRANALRSVVSSMIYDKPNDTLEVHFYIDE